MFSSPFTTCTAPHTSSRYPYHCPIDRFITMFALRGRAFAKWPMLIYTVYTVLIVVLLQLYMKVDLHMRNQIACARLMNINCVPDEH